MSTLLTDKQLSYLLSLFSQRPKWAEQFTNVQLDCLSKTEASRLITLALEVPRENPAADWAHYDEESRTYVPGRPAPERSQYKPNPGALPLEGLTMGSYWTLDGEIARVQRSEQSGRLYAMKLNADAKRFEYVRGTIYNLRAHMSLEEAEAWGARVGMCCVCGIVLTDPKSVKRGIGPVCATRV